MDNAIIQLSKDLRKILDGVIAGMSEDEIMEIAVKLNRKGYKKQEGEK